MSQQKIARTKRSWPDAIKRFFTDPNIGVLKLLLARIGLAAYVPFGVINDTIPVVGWLDNGPTFLMVIYIISKVVYYRRNPDV